MPRWQQNAAASCKQLKHGSLSNRLSGSRFRQLEAKLGIAVFKPTNDGVRDTSAGRHLLGMARPLLGQMDNIVAAVNAYRCGEAGRLVIGLRASLIVGNLLVSHPSLASSRRHPND